MYAEAYPEPANPTKSIAQFGAVAMERHATGSDGERNVHTHMTVYTSKKHYWNKVAKLSYDKYKVKLNAVAHDGYYAMFKYIKESSTKKPLAELDQEVWLSPLHPRGEALSKLLDVGATFAHARSFRKRSGTDAGIGGAAKRFRSADIFDLVTSRNIHSVVELQGLACEGVVAGDKRLAVFCTTMGSDKLEQFIQSAMQVMKAPAALELRRSSRIELLRKAAVSLPCTCSGVWIGGAVKVLGNNKEDVTAFCSDVRRAF